jgi:hypothetical protein
VPNVSGADSTAGVEEPVADNEKRRTGNCVGARTDTSGRGVVVFVCVAIADTNTNGEAEDVALVFDTDDEGVVLGVEELVFVCEVVNRICET